MKKVKLDTRGRRNRYIAQPDPKNPDAVLELVDTDLPMLLAIHHHGPLSSPYLHAFRTPACKSYRATAQRLTLITHGFNNPDNIRGEEPEPYLYRPFEGRNTHNSHTKHAIYDLTPTGIRYLMRLGLWQVNAPHNRNNWLHCFMTACITASLELECRAAGFRYIHGFELLGDDIPLKFRVPYTWQGEAVEGDLNPDAIGGIDYGDSELLFFIEAERSNKAGNTDDRTRKSYAKNILQYRSLIRDGLYKDVLGIEGGMIALNFFHTENGRRKFLREAERLCGKNSYLWTQVVNHFGGIFTPPPILSQVFQEEYVRAGKPDITLFAST